MINITLNIIAGFIVPWLFAVYLIKKDFKILLLMAPIGSVLAFTFDVLGAHLVFWHVTPLYDTEVFAALPMHWGIYPVLTAYLFYLIKKNVLKPFLLILVFAFLTTLIEFLGVLIGKVLYFNDWNIFWTFWSYLIPYILAYGYFSLLIKYEIITYAPEKK